MSNRDERVRLAIAEQAAEWYVANREGLADSAQRGTFAAWLQSSPVHVEEYLGVALIARDLPRAAQPDAPLEALLAEARRAADAPVWLGSRAGGGAERPRRALWSQAAAAAATLAALGVGLLWLNGTRVTVLHYATRHGEQMTQRLPDGSVLRLNSDSALTVRYSRAERRVELTRGEVFCEVAQQPARPFLVVAGFAEAVAVGTRFDVYRKADAIVVTVVAGGVAVRLVPDQPGAAAGGGRTVRVSAGEQIEVGAGHLPLSAAPAARRNTAWLRREIVFEGEPLAEVAAEFNRYSAKPIEIEAPALRALPISGVFSADDTPSFIAFLRSLNGVSVAVDAHAIRVSQN